MTHYREFHHFRWQHKQADKSFATTKYEEFPYVLGASREFAVCSEKKTFSSLCNRREKVKRKLVNWIIDSSSSYY